VPPSDRVQQQARLNAPDNLGGEQPLTVLAYLCILEGVAAARAGEPACANPYDPSCENGCRWQAGWLETRNAMKEAAVAGGQAQSTTGILGGHSLTATRG
jgi:hypothetical protein